MNPIPHINALILCDTIIIDKLTNKKTIVGIFQNINARKFPVLHPKMAIYVNLTDANGSYKMKVAIEDLTTGIEMGETLIPEMTLNDRLQTNEIILDIHGLRFDHPGKYALNLSINGQIAATRTFSLHVQSHD